MNSGDPMNSITRRSLLTRGAALAGLGPLTRWAALAQAGAAPAGLRAISRIAPRRSLEIAASPLSIGFETLDREMFDPERTYPHLARLGVKWARVHTGWCRTELKRGEYDFAWLDKVVDALRALGIQPWFCVGFGNRLYTPQAAFPSAVGWIATGTPEGQEAWLRYVARLAERYRGRVRHFEIWNEPNGKSFWRPLQPDPRLYTEFVKLTAPVIRRAVSDAVIIGGAVAGMETKFFQGCLEAGLGEWIDKASFHSYRTIPEKFYAEDIKQWRKLIARHHPGIGLWHGEVGAASQPGGAGGRADYAWTETRQAKFLLRRFIFDLKLKTELISYFHTVDLVNYGGADGPTGKTNFKGLLRGDYSPKPAYFAYQCLCALFDTETASADLPITFSPSPGTTAPPLGEIVSAGFTRRGRALFAYWHPAGPEMERPDGRIDLELACPPGAQLTSPVLIDPLSGEVFALEQAERTRDRWRIPNAPLADHPLLITDHTIALK